MNIIRQNWLLNRRHALRGLGVALALPMLDCMRSTRLMAEGNRAQPARSVFIYLPNGVNTLDYQVMKEGADYEFSRALKPLENQRSNITPISGLHHPAGIGHDHSCQNIWLTGAAIGHGKRNSISIDQLIATQTSPYTRITSLELSESGRSLAYNRDGIQLPADTDPKQVFLRLFQSSSKDLESSRIVLRERKSILDLVLDDARALDRKLGTDDRGRLDQYLNSVREVELRIGRSEAWLDIPIPKVDDSTRSELLREVSQSRASEYFRAFYDLIVLVLQTDMTRVITFSTGDEGKGLPIPELAINQTRHALSHHNGDKELLSRLTQSDAFNIEQFAYLLDQLSRIPDGDETLLDTTVALFGSGMAYGHSHGNANLPIVLAGGAKLGFKHGTHLDFNRKSENFTEYATGPDGQLTTSHYKICSKPANSDARLSNLLLTIAQRMGVKIDRFADSVNPIGELTA